MSRPIAISLSPNAEKDDVTLALRILFSPWLWYDKKVVQRFEKNFSEIFGDKYFALAVNSGRSALYLILKALEIGEGDEVIIQAFTCVAVPNSIIWLGARPVYVDIGDDYNVDFGDLNKKITKRTKAIIVQNTFGIPVNIKPIKDLVYKRGIFLIEDCAHSLGASYFKGGKAGTLGDVSFFSFGRDKILSSVFGGMILCREGRIYRKLKEEVEGLNYPSWSWVAQQLFHPIAFSFILPAYNIGLGKILLFLFQKIGLLSKAVYEEEKEGLRPNMFPRKMSGAQAILAQKQLSKFEAFNAHRKVVANLYFSGLSGSELILPPNIEGSVWLRFPMRHSDAKRIYQYIKNKGVLLGDWYKQVIIPVKKLDNFYYRRGSCPRAEKFSETILNLPTYPTMSLDEAKKVIELVKICLTIQ